MQRTKKIALIVATLALVGLTFLPQATSATGRSTDSPDIYRSSVTASPIYQGNDGNPYVRITAVARNWRNEPIPGRTIRLNFYPDIGVALPEIKTNTAGIVVFDVPLVNAVAAGRPRVRIGALAPTHRVRSPIDPVTCGRGISCEEPPVGHVWVDIPTDLDL